MIIFCTPFCFKGRKVLVKMNLRILLHRQNQHFFLYVKHEQYTYFSCCGDMIREGDTCSPFAPCGRYLALAAICAPPGGATSCLHVDNSYRHRICTSLAPHSCFSHVSIFRTLLYSYVNGRDTSCLFR